MTRRRRPSQAASPNPIPFHEDRLEGYPERVAGGVNRLAGDGALQRRGAAEPRVVRDGDGRPWPMSPDGDWCCRCGLPTGERDGTGGPCCAGCAAGIPDCELIPWPDGEDPGGDAP